MSEGRRAGLSDRGRRGADVRQSLASTVRQVGAASKLPARADRLGGINHKRINLVMDLLYVL